MPSSKELPREPTDLLELYMDLYNDLDTVFVITVISDTLRRGVRHFRLDGTPLARLNDVVQALTEDGEVLMDTDGSEDETRH